MHFSSKVLIWSAYFISIIPVADLMLSVFYEKHQNATVTGVPPDVVLNVSSVLECLSVCSRNQTCMTAVVGSSSTKSEFTCETHSTKVSAITTHSSSVSYRKSAADHCCPLFPNNTLQMCPCPPEESVLLTCPMKTIEDKFVANGVYKLKAIPNGKVFHAFCEISANESWIVIQHRFDGSVNFNRTWQEYKNGFGELNSEFWLGNENIHQITSSASYELKVDLITNRNGAVYPGSATYTTFKINSEVDGYRLIIGGYSGTIGDSLKYHHGSTFETWDKHNTFCPAIFHGAWWYGNTKEGCHNSNLNAQYFANGSCPYGIGLIWYHFFNSHYYSMTKTTMKIRKIEDKHLSIT